MADQRPSEVLGALPRTRPQRRSAKRPLREETGAPAKSPAPTRQRATGRAKKPVAAASKRSGGRSKPGPSTLRQPPQPRGIPSQPRAPVPQHRPEVLGTAVQAAAELAEIGLALGARTIRRAVSRIPRP